MSTRILRLLQIKTVRSAWVSLVGSTLMFLFPIYLFIAYPEQIAPAPEELVSDIALFSAIFLAAGSYVVLASWALFSPAGRKYLVEQEALPTGSRRTLWSLILHVLKVLFAGYAAAIGTLIVVVVSSLMLERNDISNWIGDHFLSSTAVAWMCWVPVMWRKLR